MPPERQRPRTTPAKTAPRSKELEPLTITNIDELKASKTYGQRVKYFEKRNSLNAPAGKFFTLHSCPTFSFSALHHVPPSIRNKDLKPTVKRLALLDQQCVIAPWENGKWLDKDGVPLIHYFNGLVKPELSDALINQLCGLTVKHPPQNPGTGESRHCGFTAWKKSLPLGTPCGVLRLTLHNQAGHPVPVWHPSVSKHLIGGSSKQSAASLMFRSSQPIKDLSEYLSLIFAALDPVRWQRYRQAYLGLSDVYPLRAMDGSRIQCFVGYYLLFNMLTTYHYDRKDPPDGWAAMVVLGKFNGANLCFPEIGVALPYQARDVVFVRSWALKHFIRRFSGERYVIVFATSQHLLDWIDVYGRTF
jgi:hypothetical protein